MKSGSIKKNILTGFIVLVPIGATLYIFWFIFKFFAGFLLPLVKEIPGISEFPSFAGYLISFIASVFILWLLGLIASNIFGAAVLRQIEKIFVKVPFVNKVYIMLKEVIELIFIKKKAFKEVVFIEYPRKGLKTFAFITGETKDSEGARRYAIFVPSTPNPTTGFLIIASRDEFQKVNISVDEAIRVIMSGGIIGEIPVDKKS